MSDPWIEYQSQTANGKPRALLMQALAHVPQKGTALELGAGALNEAQYLLDEGFAEVVAVDVTPQFKKVSAKSDSLFRYIQSSFEEYDFEKDYFDLVSSQYALPFTEKGQFVRVWQEMVQSLKSGGVFCGQLFGKKDAWASTGSIVSHSKEEVDTLIEGFEVLSMEEVEKESPTASGQSKHWHYFELILKKKIRGCKSIPLESIP